jgi:glycosyltransferase involved in cell wall biosynthesis
MRIALLLSQSLESPSGLGRYEPIARQLSRLGHQVEIFALHPSFYALEKTVYETEDLRIHYVGPMHVKKEGNRKSYYPTYQLLPLMAASTWKMSRAARKSRADILYICKPHPMNSLAGLAASIGKGTRIFLDCDDYEAASNRFSAPWQRRLIARFEKFIPRHAHIVTTNTEFMRNKLIEWGIPTDRIYYLSNGIESERFQTPTEAHLAELRSSIGLSGKRVVAYIGSLSITNHPVDLLLQAFKQVQETLPDASLLLVGGGEDYEHLKRLADELGITQATHFQGRVLPEFVADYYHLADLTVDPVHDDDAARGRNPLKLFESWACGVPFVTASVGDRPTLLGTPPAGLMSKPGDPSSLADCIIQILSNPSLAAELKFRGSERVKQFTWNSLILTLENLFNGKSHARFV